MAAKHKEDDRREKHLFYACCEDVTQEGAWTVHIREVVNNWERLGMSVTLFTPRIWPFSVPPSCTVVYVPTINLRIVREYLFLLILPLYLIVFGLKRRPAALYCREMSLMAVAAAPARLFRIPLIMEINGFLLGDLRMIGASRARRAIFRFLQQVNLLVADRVVFAGPTYLARFRAEFMLDERKVFFVPNGVDTGLFSPGDRTIAAQKLDLDINKRYITFVGTFYPHSLTPTIVQAAKLIVAKYTDVGFIMVGDGHDLALCKAKAAELRISHHVVFPGMKKNRAIPAYLRASTVLINLIEGSEDVSSMKLLEYMSSGGAVVVNSGSAFGLTLAHRRNCYRIKKARPETLARAIEALLDDDKLRREIGENARAFVLAHFSWKRTAQRLLSIIDEARDRH